VSAQPSRGPVLDFTAAPSLSRSTVSTESVAYWTLRIGAALCFIGHGAFGLITKEAWLRYFAVVGIPEWLAWKLMPIVGAVDVLAAMAVLFAPRGLPLLYMVVWATWTALLRPLAGESVFEAIERAGNYGVPFSLLLLTGFPITMRGLFEPLMGAVPDERVTARVRRALQWSTCLLLLGHGALGAFSGKPILTEHYAAIGFSSGTTSMVGWFELALALTVALRPAVGLLVFVAVWKLATESLYLVNGSPIWELIERGGSVAAPLALAALTKPKRARLE